MSSETIGYERAHGLCSSLVNHSSTVFSSQRNCDQMSTCNSKAASNRTDGLMPSIHQLIQMFYGSKPVRQPHKGERERSTKIRHLLHYP